ncbi:pregnancy-specific beta-1-glycoprotein 2-like [Dreissena polymorpha]|nr:pregnancy-specific beta-1-glycoprotein 2-like [Dreissena polymorpha]
MLCARGLQLRKFSGIQYLVKRLTLVSNYGIEHYSACDKIMAKITGVLTLICYLSTAFQTSYGLFSVTLTPDLESISVIAGVSTQLQCLTSPSIPAPRVRWFKNGSAPGALPVETTYQSSSSRNETVTLSLLTLVPVKQDDGCIVYCTAQSRGYAANSTRKPSLNVMYPTTKPICSINGYETNASTITVDQGSTFFISCSSESNPAPEYTWTFPGGTIFGQNLTLGTIRKSHEGLFTFEARNTMVPTGGPSVSSTFAHNVFVFVRGAPTNTGIVMTRITFCLFLFIHFI